MLCHIIWIIFIVDLVLSYKVDGIPMGTNCVPLAADLILFCYEKDFMGSRSEVNQAIIIQSV